MQEIISFYDDVDKILSEGVSILNIEKWHVATKVKMWEGLIQFFHQYPTFHKVGTINYEKLVERNYKLAKKLFIFDETICCQSESEIFSLLEEKEFNQTLEIRRIFPAYEISISNIEFYKLASDFFIEIVIKAINFKRRYINCPIGAMISLQELNLPEMESFLPTCVEKKIEKIKIECFLL